MVVIGLWRHALIMLAYARRLCISSWCGLVLLYVSYCQKVLMGRVELGEVCCFAWIVAVLCDGIFHFGFRAGLIM